MKQKSNDPWSGLSIEILYTIIAQGAAKIPEVKVWSPKNWS